MNVVLESSKEERRRKYYSEKNVDTLRGGRVLKCSKEGTLNDILPFKYPQIGPCTSCAEATTSLNLMKENSSRKRQVRSWPSSPRGEQQIESHLSAKAILNPKQRMRDVAKRHACPYCTYSATFPSRIRRHIKNKHSQSHVCSHCGKKFNDFSQLRSHASAEHSKVHRCHYCQYSHKTLAEVRKHSIANHGKGTMCTVAGCNLRIARRCLKRHLATAHPDNMPSVYPGNVCVKPFTDEGSSFLTCPHCDFTTSDTEDFNAHLMNVHERGILCPMPDCTIHVLLGDLDNHLKSAHGQCDNNAHDRLSGAYESDETICSSVSLSKGKVLHSDTTPSLSERTSKSNNLDEFSSDSDDYDIPKKPLVKLTGTHIGLQCAICGKHYRTSYLLKKHIKNVHDKVYARPKRIKKYACDWQSCDKAFTTPGLLEDHLNFHRGVEPYRCNSCDLSFSARARFAVHLSKYHKMSIRDYTSVANFLAPSNVSSSKNS